VTTTLPGLALAFDERALAGGLTALAVHNPGPPTCALGVVLRVSQLDEGVGEAGLANLTGLCLEEGTRRLGAVALAEAVEELGASLSVAASGAVIQCPADQAAAACELLREVVLEPGFRARDVARVKDEVVAEMEADAADPATVAAHAFRSEVYGKHPFARPHYGFRESVDGFRPDDLRAFHARWFVPHEGFVVLSGPWETQRSLDLLTEVFGGVRGARVTHARPAPPPFPNAVRDTHIAMEREQVHVQLGHPGIRRKEPDYHALLVMDHVLGTGPGFTARIPRRLRDELGLCYSVDASITDSAGEEPGSFRCYIGTSPQHRQLAVERLRAEVRALRTMPPAVEEVRVAKDYLVGSHVLGLERNAQLLRYVVRCKRFDLGFDYVERFRSAVRAIGAEDVRAVAERHLDPDRVVVVSAGAS
jgi:zinc protease